MHICTIFINLNLIIMGSLISNLISTIAGSILQQSMNPGAPVAQNFLDKGLNSIFNKGSNNKSYNSVGKFFKKVMNNLNK